MKSPLRFCFVILIGIILFALAGCGGKKSICPQPTGTPQYLSIPPGLLASPTPAGSKSPLLMEINGRKISMDRVISGPLCNDRWSGTVYVTCDVQIYAWVEDPIFLKGCDLKITPDTVVYVAHHNNAAYYKGCSCHTGELSNP
jgi:hypothetical protein